jgi:peroxiredoxin Q/BCP
MASSSTAGARRRNSQTIRIQRRRRRNIVKSIMYIAAGASFVLVAAFLVLLSRGTTHNAGQGMPLTGMAPDFTLPSVNGGSVTLSSYRGKRNVLLFFNEGYGCAPCWEQSQEIQQRSADLEAAGIEYLVVMVDPPSLIKSEVRRWNLTMPVLSDTDRTVSRSYNTLGFGMHADKPNHTFVFVDKDGQIRWWKDYASMRAPTDDVIKNVQALSAGG